MVIGTLAMLFVVPSLFIAFQWLQEKIKPLQTEPTEDWEIQEEMKRTDEELREAGIDTGK